MHTLPPRAQTSGAAAIALSIRGARIAHSYRPSRLSGMRKAVTPHPRMNARVGLNPASTAILGASGGAMKTAAKELVAELGAVFLCADLAITREVRESRGPALEILGATCLSMLSEALRLYFMTWERELGSSTRTLSWRFQPEHGEWLRQRLTKNDGDCFECCHCTGVHVACYHADFDLAPNRTIRPTRSR